MIRVLAAVGGIVLVVLAVLGVLVVVVVVLVVLGVLVSCCTCCAWGVTSVHYSLCVRSAVDPCLSLTLPAQEQASLLSSFNQS